MTTEGIDYVEFIAKLKHQRAQLVAQIKAVDSAIAGIEVLLTTTRPQDIPMPQRISSKDFTRLSAQEAVLEWLGASGRPQTTKQIMVGVDRCGFKTNSENLYSIVYTALKRLAEKENSPIRKTPEGWALKEG